MRQTLIIGGLRWNRIPESSRIETPIWSYARVHATQVCECSYVFLPLCSGYVSFSYIGGISGSKCLLLRTRVNKRRINLCSKIMYARRIPQKEVKCFLLYKKYIQLGFVFLIHSNYPLPMSQAFCIHLYLHKRTAFGWAFHPSSCDIIISKPTGKVWNTKDSIPEVEDLPMVLFFHCIDTVVGISINFFFMLHTIRLRLVISMESPTNKGLTWLNAFCCHLNVHSSCSKHGTTSYILLWPLWVTYLDLGQEFQFVPMNALLCYPAEY